MSEPQKPTCQRCHQDKIQPYSNRWYCLTCGWTWHQLSESVEQEVATRLQTTGKLGQVTIAKRNPDEAMIHLSLEIVERDKQITELELQLASEKMSHEGCQKAYKLMTEANDSLSNINHDLKQNIRTATARLERMEAALKQSIAKCHRCKGSGKVIINCHTIGSYQAQCENCRESREALRPQEPSQ